MGWHIITNEEAQALWECGVKLRYSNSIWSHGELAWHKFNHSQWSPAVYTEVYNGYTVRFKAQVEGE